MGPDYRRAIDCGDRQFRIFFFFSLQSSKKYILTGSEWAETQNPK